MDLVSKTHRALSSETTPTSTLFRPVSLHSPSSSEPSFPIIAIAIIGILATAFLLVAYYIFVIKCCLSWHRIDVLRRFSLSRSSRSHDESLIAAAANSAGPAEASRGLDESTIRSIPIFLFRKNQNNQHNTRVYVSECAVCLSEFEDLEKLRIIPNCSHVFHIDCIDVWLQTNNNCPLCRTTISISPPIFPAGRFFPADQIVAPSPSPIDPSPYAGSLAGGDEDYVVIELGSNDPSESNNQDLNDQTLGSRDDQGLLFRFGSKRGARKFQKGTSMGDECIDMGREKDEQFSVQTIRRSFSMDSSADRKMFMAIQEALRGGQGQRNNNNGVCDYDDNNNNVEGSCSGNSYRSVRRSFFSFGHGISRGSSRSAVLPVYLEP